MHALIFLSFFKFYCIDFFGWLLEKPSNIAFFVDFVIKVFGKIITKLKKKSHYVRLYDIYCTRKMLHEKENMLYIVLEQTKNIIFITASDL